MKKLSCEEFNAFESPIDTKYFGVTSASVTLKRTCSVKQQRELLSFLRDFEFVTITNKGNDPINNRWLGEKTRAFLTDMNIQLGKKVMMNARRVDGVSAIMDNFPANERIVQIAETSFKFSRFLNDPYLPLEKARKIYADITRNAFGKEGRFFVIFGAGEAISGFLLFRINSFDLSSTIELIAINQDYQRRDIGRSLIGSMEYYVAEKCMDTIKVGTQLSNIGALNFYAIMGFRHLECNSIYHYWPLKP